MKELLKNISHGSKFLFFILFEIDKIEKKDNRIFGRKSHVPIRNSTVLGTGGVPGKIHLT